MNRWCLFVMLVTVRRVVAIERYNEEYARMFVDKYMQELTAMKNRLYLSSWMYESCTTLVNQELENAVHEQMALLERNAANTLKLFKLEEFKDENLKRQIKLLKKIDKYVLTENDLTQLMNLINHMTNNFENAKVCEYKNKSNCTLGLEPEISQIMSKSRDPEELQYYWTEYYNNAGRPSRELFSRYVSLVNQAARLNGFASQAENWLAEYEDDTFEQQAEDLMMQLKPFYEQLHAYVRHKLREKYGNIVTEKGPLPMHLMGNVYSQSWTALANFTMPFPENAADFDVTAEMLRQNYTPVKIFQMGDDFFTSMGLLKLPPIFWAKSILEKPKDGREMVCHPSAWYFYNDLELDVRVKQCTLVTMDHFITVHHELGHIQYYLQYNTLPVIYREGANPGFHEAVGDTIGLSVATPKHLKRIGLLTDISSNVEAKVNQLYMSALAKLVFLPFAYVMDKYRWSVFRNKIKPTEYNCRFWELFRHYTGVEPPVKRTEEDFDPAAKFHTCSDTEYLRYFIATIIQFTFHRTLCTKAGQFSEGWPAATLSDCDIYESKEAGNALREMLAMGLSKPWPDALEVLTGTRKMSAEAMLQFFEPLNTFLVKKNKETGAYVGWEATSKSQCP